MARIVLCRDLQTYPCHSSYLGHLSLSEEFILPQWLEGSKGEDIWIYDRGFPFYRLFWLYTQQ